ncbi:MAG: hypothetical protein ABH956_02205 [Candidatus Nealsonbacteria bacterium]
MFPPEFLNLLDFLSPVLLPMWQIIKHWWWLPLPFILWWPFSSLWLWWRVGKWIEKKKSIFLEIKIPKEVLKPVRAMEIVMSALRQTIYAPPDWWEKWIDGQIQQSYSFEIISIGGRVHFLIKIPEDIRDSVESIIYSQYPDAEISLFNDYTKDVPQDIPNKDWDLWATDYILLKPDAYPIRTFMEFETEREAKEEKRVDPLAGLLEAMDKIKSGEQLWIQIIAQPVTDKEIPWITEAKKLRDELAKRTKKPVKRKALLFEAADVLISGKLPDESKKEEGAIMPEMQLTSGERDIIKGIENKIAKPGFKTTIRFVFLGKKDVFNKANLRLPFGYFASYSTENLNYLVPWGKTIVKIHKSWFLPINLLLSKRLYLRKRKLFRNYVMRVTPLFPLSGGTFVLNTEELASLFHFPGRSSASAPSVGRIESKKGEPPITLPTE